MRSTWLVLSAASLSLCVPRLADACSPPPCFPGAFVPGNAGARVPSNVPGLYWRPMSGPSVTVTPANVVLESTAAPGVSIAFTAQKLANGDYVLVPGAPLVEGNTYRMTDQSQCELTGDKGPEVTFSVGPQVALPVSLGALTATPTALVQMDLATVSGSCFSEATVAQASIDLAASDTAAPWMDILQFETLVDDRPWHYASSIGVAPAPGASPVGRAHDRVFMVCDSKDQGVGDGLASGSHVVTMQATLPGTTKLVMSNSVQVTLSCNATGADAGADADPDPGTAGCSAAGPGAAPWLALAGLALVRRRTRRQPRREADANRARGSSMGRVVVI